MAERFYDRAAYRWASVVLLLAVLSIPVAVSALGGPGWFAFLLVLAPFIMLAVVTNGRLRDAGLSGAWVLLLLLIVNVGPVWHGPASLDLYLGNLVNLIPIILGWTVPAGAGASPAAAMSR